MRRVQLALVAACLLTLPTSSTQAAFDLLYTGGGPPVFDMDGGLPLTADIDPVVFGPVLDIVWVPGPTPPLPPTPGAPFHLTLTFPDPIELAPPVPGPPTILPTPPNPGIGVLSPWAPSGPASITAAFFFTGGPLVPFSPVQTFAITPLLPGFAPDDELPDVVLSGLPMPPTPLLPPAIAPVPIIDPITTLEAPTVGYDVQVPKPIPEASALISWALMAVTGLCLGWYRRR